MSTDARRPSEPPESGRVCSAQGTLRTRNGYETVTCGLPVDHDGDHEAEHGTALSRWPVKGRGLTPGEALAAALDWRWEAEPPHVPSVSDVIADVIEHLRDLGYVIAPARTQTDASDGS